jgi:signal transduction histidine kinase/ActR/RegA family two-component response regulator
VASLRKGRLRPPAFETDSEKTRIAGNLNAIALAALLVTVLHSLVLLVLSSWAGLMWSIPRLLLITFVLIMLHRGRVRSASILALSGAWLIQFAVAATGGGVRTPGFGGMVLIVLVAGLLFGQRAAFIVAALSTLSGLLLVYAEVRGMLPPPSASYTPSVIWAAQAVWFVLAAVLLHLATSSINEALNRARHELAERKMVEQALIRTEEQLRQSQKMEAVGRLAGGVAHDFNNLLTPIIGHAELVLLALDRGHPARKDLEEISKAAERAASLTKQLLAMSRKQIVQPKVVKLNTVVADMEEMLRRLVGEDLEFIVTLGPGLGQVRADPGQLQQVLMNLVVNARDAMPHGGRLSITTANVYLDDISAAADARLGSGHYVVLAVSDSGCGMDSETQARIFEPFFTTKDHSKGTGLGLSTAYGIIEQSGGHILVHSELGFGSTFKVYLPMIGEEGEILKTELIEPALEKGSETILLVEDEDAVRELARQILRLNGYTVLQAARGHEALRVSLEYDGCIDLLLTDVIMPQMNGRELAELLTKQRPELRVVYMSGYAENAIVHQGALEPGVVLVEKPFNPEVLVRTVRQCLDRQDSLESVN